MCRRDISRAVFAAAPRLQVWLTAAFFRGATDKRYDPSDDSDSEHEGDCVYDSVIFTRRLLRIIIFYIDRSKIRQPAAPRTFPAPSRKTHKMFIAENREISARSPSFAARASL